MSITTFRRSVARLAACALLAFSAATAQADQGRSSDPASLQWEWSEATVAQLQAAMASGRLTSEQLVRGYLRRIQARDTGTLGVNAIIELNPDALALARQADALRRRGTVLGPLHGIPVLLKDNIDTGDAMQTTAGSLGLVGRPAPRDATVAAKLRAGGAVILGKTNLSEWANFRSFFASSGWSGVGGQTNNPYGIDRNPCGSSSGSGAATSANFATLALGTETDGSVVCPASANGVVGLKPTVGLTSRAGVVPIAHTQDTVGIHARTVADAAVTLGIIQSRGGDGRDAATAGVPLGWRGRARPANIPSDYTRFLNAGGLRGARLGVTRQGVDSAPAPVIEAFEDALDALRAAGATLIDLDGAGFQFPSADGEFVVLLYEFRGDLQSYLATRRGVPLAGGTLADAIAFDEANAQAEMPYFGQEIFELAQALPTDPDAATPADAGGLSYNASLENGRLVGVNGIDKALRDFGLDAVVAPTDNPAWATDLLYGDRFLFGSSSLAAAPGYPIIHVPSGFVFGLPFGISFFGTAFSEPTLIRLASGFEAATHARLQQLPTFARTLPNDFIAGTTPVRPKHRKSRDPEHAQRRPRRM